MAYKPNGKPKAVLMSLNESTRGKGPQLKWRCELMTRIPLGLYHKALKLILKS